MKLTKRHQQVIEMLFSGTKRKTIARTVNISDRTLYNWIADPDFSKAYDDYVRGVMKKTSGPALNAMIGLLDARSEMARYSAAKDLLDRNNLVDKSDDATKSNQWADVAKRVQERGADNE